MKTSQELAKELEDNAKGFDQHNFLHCVDRAMLLVQHSQAKMVDRGQTWPYHSDAVLRAACERAIEDRPHGEDMWVSAIRFMMDIEGRARVYNGIYCESTAFISRTQQETTE